MFLARMGNEFSLECQDLHREFLDFVFDRNCELIALRRQQLSQCGQTSAERWKNKVNALFSVVPRTQSDYSSKICTSPKSTSDITVSALFPEFCWPDLRISMDDLDELKQVSLQDFVRIFLDVILYLCCLWENESESLTIIVKKICQITPSTNYYCKCEFGANNWNKQIFNMNNMFCFANYSHVQ